MPNPYPISPEDRKQTYLWARDSITAVRFGQAVQGVNAVAQSSLYDTDGIEAFLLCIEDFLVEEFSTLFDKLLLKKKRKRKRKSLLEALPVLMRKISQKDVCFHKPGNEVAACVSALILGRLGYIYKPGNELASREIVKTNTHPDDFFSRWDAAIKRQLRDISIQEWQDEFILEFKSWIDLVRDVAVDHYATRHTKAESEFDTLVATYWEKGHHRRDTAFIPTQLISETTDWYISWCRDFGVQPTDL